MSAAALPEELIVLVQVVGEDSTLREWFEGLEAMTDESRVAELRRLAAAMEVGGEEAPLVDAVRLLAHPRIFRGARAALAECRTDW